MPESADTAARRLARICGGWDPQEAWDGADLSRRAVSLWSRPAARSVVVVLAIGLCLAAYWAYAGRPREAHVIAGPKSVVSGSPAVATGSVPTDAVASMAEVSSTAAPAVPDLVVHVIGAVRRPGIVTLPAGSRVVDAVAAAGGLTRPRAAASVNLARLVVDGEQIAVGVAAAPGAPPAGAGAAGPPSSTAVNLNTADAAALEGLPGVGPVIAQRIVDWRTANGPFRSIDELGEVSGIGDSILAQVRDHAVL